MHSLSAKPGCSWSCLNEMKSSSGQATVPASVCPFPHTMFFNDSVCRHQDRWNGIPQLVTGSVAVALGCGKVLGVTASTAEHPIISVLSNALLYRQQNPSPHPLGPGPLMEPGAQAPLLLLSILRIPLAAKCRVWASVHSSLYFLCWPEVWSSWFTHKPRGTESTKLWYIITTGD